LAVTVRTTDDGQSFVFCRNASADNRSVHFDVQLDDGRTLSIDHMLPRSIVTVLDLPAGKTNSNEGTWWCEPQAFSARPPAPAPVRVGKACSRDDTDPTQWRAISPGTSVIQAG